MHSYFMAFEYPKLFAEGVIGTLYHYAILWNYLEEETKFASFVDRKLD